MYIKKILVLVLMLGLVAASIFSYYVYTAIFTPNTAFNNDEAYLYIPSGASFSEVEEMITPLVLDLEKFVAVAKQKGYTTNVKSGKYRIPQGANNNTIVNALRSSNVPVRVAFNNQETLADLAGRIATQIEPDSIELLQAFTDASFLKANGFTAENGLSVYLPNTYEFFWNTSAVQFRDRMLKEYNTFWNSERLKKAEHLGLSTNEVIALAAIVHKETVKIEERPRVAGVYMNRIKRGMLLQADPTVIYAIKKQSGNFDTVIKRVLYKDLEIDSPYNTYKYAGIPPGPIAMPDISAIDAVLNYEQHKYLYFVADVSNFGYHMFASTLAQHNRNKAQYVNWVNKQRINR